MKNEFGNFVLCWLRPDVVLEKRLFAVPERDRTLLLLIRETEVK